MMGNNRKPCRLKQLAKVFFKALDLTGCRQAMCRTRPEDVSETRERILLVARKVFAEKGANGTVREICAKADANVSAVNYHFGNKERLLVAVLEQYLNETVERYPLLGRIEPTAPVEERFFGFILSCMSRMLLGLGGREWRLLILLIDGFSHKFEEFSFVAESHWEALHDTAIPIIDELTGKKWELDQLEKLSSGLFSHMFFYAMHAERFMALRSGKQISESDVAGMAQHITALSIGGMTHYSEYMDADMDFPNLFSRGHYAPRGESGSLQ